MRGKQMRTDGLAATYKNQCIYVGNSSDRKTKCRIARRYSSELIDADSNKQQSKSFPLSILKKKWEKGQHSLKSTLLHLTKAFLKGSTAFDSSFYAYICGKGPSALKIHVGLHFQPTPTFQSQHEPPTKAKRK